MWLSHKPSLPKVTIGSAVNFLSQHIQLHFSLRFGQIILFHNLLFIFQLISLDTKVGTMPMTSYLYFFQFFLRKIFRCCIQRFETGFPSSQVSFYQRRHNLQYWRSFSSLCFSHIISWLPIFIHCYQLLCVLIQLFQLFSCLV